MKKIKKNIKKLLLYFLDFCEILIKNLKRKGLKSFFESLRLSFFILLGLLVINLFNSISLSFEIYSLFFALSTAVFFVVTFSYEDEAKKVKKVINVKKVEEKNKSKKVS